MSTIQWAPAVFQAVKWQGRGVDHSGPSSSEVKNEKVYNSASAVCLHDRYGGKFSFKIRAQLTSFNKFIHVSLRLTSVCMLQLQQEGKV